MRIDLLSRVLALVIAGLLLSADCFAVSYVESVSGDLSDSGSAPTALGNFAAGVHSVAGTMGGSPIDRDIFVFAVPSGATLTAIDLSSFSSPGTVGGGSFFSLNLGSTIGAPNAAGSFGHGIVGSTGDLAAQFITPIPLPLSAGNYTMWIQETAGDPADYQVDFTVVPEPGGLLMLGMLGCFLVFWKRHHG